MDSFRAREKGQNFGTRVLAADRPLLPQKGVDQGKKCPLHLVRA